MNMHEPTLKNPPFIPFRSANREAPRTQGYSERDVQDAVLIPGKVDIPDPWRIEVPEEIAEQLTHTPTVTEKVPAVPLEEESVVDTYLATQFDQIKTTIHNYLNSGEEKKSLEAALAEVEFYKKVIADAKVAWTKAVPHEEFAWDDLIDLGTILSRTPGSANTE